MRINNKKFKFASIGVSSKYHIFPKASRGKLPAICHAKGKNLLPTKTPPQDADICKKCKNAYKKIRKDTYYMVFDVKTPDADKEKQKIGIDQKDVERVKTRKERIRDKLKWRKK